MQTAGSIGSYMIIIINADEREESRNTHENGEN